MANVLNSTQEFHRITLDFTRLLSNALVDRKFEYVEYPDEKRSPVEFLNVDLIERELTKYFEGSALEMSKRINPDWTKCFKLPCIGYLEAFVATNPSNGLSVRAIRYWDCFEGVRYRFDVAFS